jgi:ADP-ribose pyrophosphatase
MDKVEILSKKLVFNDFFKVQEAIVRFLRFDGQMSKPVRRLVLERGDAVSAIIFNKDTQKIIVINQFRYPTFEKGPGWINELVAGMVDQDEKPEDAMRREIQEEIGYKVNNLKYIASFYVSPGGTSERIFLYYAEIDSNGRMSAGGGLASENEDIQQIEMSPQELWKALDAGEIVDAKTLIGAMWLRQHLEQA